jgi:hypothetical protein
MASTERPLLAPRCGHCGVQSNLLRCGSCRVVQYCSKAHQAADRSGHKHACKLVLKLRNVLDRDEEKLRASPGDMFTPADVFESSVGHFWGILGTRDYMRSRYALVEAIMKIKTFDAAQSALDHLNDMLRLSRSDNLGVRNLVPALYSRLGRDQESYDFVKWHATTGQRSDYDWGDTSLPYLDVKNADVFESVKYMCGKYLSLNHVVAVGLLKIKLLLDLKDLQNSLVIGRRLPQEIVDYTKSFLPRTTIISQNKEIMIRVDHATQIKRLKSQVIEVHSAVKGYNPYFWKMLLAPGHHLVARPEAYSPRSLEEAQLAVQFSYDSWNEMPGTLEFVKGQFGY